MIREAEDALKVMLSNHVRVQEKASHLLGMDLEPISPRRLPEKLRCRSPTIAIPPRVDLATTREASTQLPERAQRILDSWWGWSHQRFCWVNDRHPDMYGCHRLMREWIDKDVEETGALYPHRALVP